MFRKYEKTFRLLTPKIKVLGKFNLCHKEQVALLCGKIEITEKMDGANVAIIRGNNNKWVLQKRRGLAEQGVHAQYSFFWNWARHNEEKILKIPNGWKVYGELMYAKHNIYYDELPSYFLVFDIWDGREYLHYDNRIFFIKEFGFQHVPILYYGNEKIDVDSFMYIKSACSSNLAEGIVIKNYKKQIRGKLVRPEFMKDLEEDDHWATKAVKRNKLAENVNVFS